MLASDVARVMRVSADTVRSWIVAGELPAFDASRAGSPDPAYRVDPDDLDEFRRRRAVAPINVSRVKAAPRSVLGL